MNNRPFVDGQFAVSFRARLSSVDYAITPIHPSMSRILVFQHVAAEPLGTLDPLIRGRGHRIRFVNSSGSRMRNRTSIVIADWSCSADR
ncbi:hypothetical protein [Lysobacter sp. Root494]|uniref:hypothetical protein n=1 Tax=Lysobacter sp. Root494 TaxID=1736549 RepID=UPI0012F930D0|nr:hypothetical protein [Lysobacter sp. Root494]